MFNEMAKSPAESSSIRECLPNYEHQIQQHKQALESNKALQSALLTNLQYGALKGYQRRHEIEQLVYITLGMLSIDIPKGIERLKCLIKEAEKGRKNE